MAGKQRKWQTAEFGLLNKRTGEVYDAELRLARRQRGVFMKLWQGTGWAERIDELQGNSLKVLYYLVHKAGWQNTVPGPSEVARQTGKRQPHISRAYAELIKTNVLIKRDGNYSLNPYFCWKGSDQQYDEALLTAGKPFNEAQGILDKREK